MGWSSKIVENCIFQKIVDKFTMKCGTPINEQEFD